MDDWESNRLNNPFWGWGRTEDLVQNHSSFSPLLHLSSFLSSKVVSTVHKYSEQIRWWTETSKGVVYISFLFSIITQQFMNGLGILITGWTMISGFALCFSLCKFYLSINWKDVFKRAIVKISHFPK